VERSSLLRLHGYVICAAFFTELKTLAARMPRDAMLDGDPISQHLGGGSDPAVVMAKPTERDRTSRAKGVLPTKRASRLGLRTSSVICFAHKL
jgi:hypothetical protein